MTNELYLHTLRKLRDGCKEDHMDTEAEALEAAIQALSCDGDAVSRIAVFECFDGVVKKDDYFEYIKNVITKIRDLPSAQPEIIRCGKCTHKDKKIDYYHYLGRTICERDYCSYAERRTDG